MQIRVILIGTSHPGNLGAVARAMKVMGLVDLWLVNPLAVRDEEAYSRAVAGADVLRDAQIVENLAQAIADCHWTLTCSAQKSSLNLPIFSPRQALQVADQRLASTQRLGLIFGRESSGVTTEELAQSQGIVTIPTHSHYRSLNLAAAVQILAYEYQTLPSGTIEQTMSSRHYATSAELTHYFNRLELLLRSRTFLRSPVDDVMQKLRCIAARAHLEAEELRLLEGIVKGFQG